MKYQIIYGSMFGIEGDAIIETGDIKGAIDLFWKEFAGKIIWQIITIF